MLVIQHSHHFLGNIASCDSPTQLATRTDSVLLPKCVVSCAFTIDHARRCCKPGTISGRSGSSLSSPRPPIPFCTSLGTARGKSRTVSGSSREDPPKHMYYFSPLSSTIIITKPMHAKQILLAGKCSWTQPSHRHCLVSVSAVL